MRDQDGAGSHLPPLAELFLVDRLAMPLRAVPATLALLIAAGWGLAALALQEHEASLRAGGASLGALGTLFADGSSALTAWPGWAAAVLLGLSALRLRRAAIEPPAGRRRGDGLSASRLRAGLRREYLWGRIALVAVTLLALADLGRLAVNGVARILHVSAATGSVPWTLLEVAGLTAAAAALAAWLLSFRAQLDTVGALDRPASAGTAADPQMRRSTT
ncbi:MAG TPA: hypothetical protein VEK76_11815 [Candidatus Binatia bacterium]|nr:hypothetical protein [Candidatus Binatia bacterium]